jgi:hypothetical protein
MIIERSSPAGYFARRRSERWIVAGQDAKAKLRPAPRSRSLHDIACISADENDG